MSISAVIAGAYTGSYIGGALGYTRRGYNINFSQRTERIEESDLYGQMLIDKVYRGGALTIDTIARVYGSNVTAALTQWASVFGRAYSAVFPISMLASTRGGSLVLTAVAGTPASVSPATFTAFSIIADDQLQMIFNSQARDVPLRFDVLVQDSGGTGTLFVTS